MLYKDYFVFLNSVIYIYDMRGWKSILRKYLIEFTVIVLGITTSYFVEN